MRKTTKITLDALAARYLANATLAAMARGDSTPVLNAARLQMQDGVLVGVSTDRYRAHRVFIDTVAAPKNSDGFLVPRDAVLWLSKNAATFSKRSYNAFRPLVDIAFTPEDPSVPSDTGRVEFTVRRGESLPDRVTFVASMVRGNFPPVWTLLDAAAAAEESARPVRLNLDFMARMRALAPDAMPPRIKFTKPSPDAKKAGAVYVAYASKDKTFAEGLLQPTTDGE